MQGLVGSWEVEPEKASSHEHMHPEDARVPYPLCSVCPCLFCCSLFSLASCSLQAVDRNATFFLSSLERQQCLPVPFVMNSHLDLRRSLHPSIHTDTSEWEGWCPASHCQSSTGAGPLQKMTESQTPLGRYARTSLHHILTISCSIFFSIASPYFFHENKHCL